MVSNYNILSPLGLSTRCSKFVKKFLQFFNKVAQKLLNISKSYFMVAPILIFAFTYLLQNVAVNDDWASKLLK